MLKNYFRISFRNLSHNKVYAAINMLGLATGIAVCLVIFLVIRFETSFDNFHQKKARIYRVLTEYHHADSKDIFYGKGVPFALPQALQSSFTELEEVAPVFADYNDQLNILNGNGGTERKFKEEKGVFYTSPAFFKIFDFPLLAGTYASLKDPGNVLLTKESAEKYFGDWKQAVGKTIKINNRYTLKVSGILASIPANTDFQLKAVIAYGTGFTGEIARSKEWDGTGDRFGCYFLLPPNASASGFNKQLIAYSKKMKAADNKDVQTIQSLNAEHYDTQAGNFSGKTISRNLIRAMWLIAIFILLIACVNFTNLSTAQAVNRAKEVGVRKVLGSNRWQLQLQFIAETFLIVLASIILSLLIAWLVLPYFNNLLELPLSIGHENVLSIGWFLLAMSLAITFLAGFYPSVVLSAFNPINALKSKLSAKSNKGISLRRGLVVFQFIIAQSLIIATLVIARQMSYFSSQPLGFDKNTIVNIPVPEDSVSNSRLGFLKDQLKTVKGIQNISFNSNTPVEDNNDNWSFINYNHSIKHSDFYSIVKMADNEYVPGFKLPLVAGRNLGVSDTIREVLVNEMVLKNLGVKNPQDALNKEIEVWDKKGTIVGVLKNFYTRSFRDDLAPLVLASNKREYSEASIKLDSRELTASMKSIEKIWGDTYPDYVFEYKFMDEKIDSFYKNESQLSHLYNIFAMIAIFLSCLGLYGLASFMAVQRIKEVGIRKVLGASGSHIVYLFSREFIILIAIAFLIATPLTWYFMNQWLQNYPFRIELSARLFLTGGLASVIIAITTVSFQAIKAAMSNPVTSLRSE
jgi:putative ABC transport system permease protein